MISSKARRGQKTADTYIHIYIWLKQYGQGKIQRADLLILEPQEPGLFQCVHVICNTDLKYTTKGSTSEWNMRFSYFCSWDHQWIQRGMSWQRPVGLCHLRPCESLAGCIPYAERASVHFRGFLEGKAKSEVSVGDTAQWYTPSALQTGSCTINVWYISQESHTQLWICWYRSHHWTLKQ